MRRLKEWVAKVGIAAVGLAVAVGIPLALLFAAVYVVRLAWRLAG